MTPLDLTVDVLLAAGVAAQWICSLGVLTMRGPFDKLHYAGAGATLGPVLIGTAVFIKPGWSSGGLDVVATVALLVLPAPATTMALARAARRIDEGSIAPKPEELVEETP
ncbi:MAG: cation:proton antiporter [Gaiellaceae bacterium]